MDNQIKVYWSGRDEKKAKHVLNTEHPEKMMLKMHDGLFIITTLEDFEIAVKKSETKQ
jgi:cytochrome c oxidase subunit IV